MQPFSSIFTFHVGSNTGYAIAPLEATFYEVGLQLALGDASRVHFAYPDFKNGRPHSLPEGFDNLYQFDYRDRSHGNLVRLAGYVREHSIEAALFFDIQPDHPVFRHLHRAGVRAALGYWGAPICPRMPAWRLAINRARFALSRSRTDGLIFESHAMADFALYGRGVPGHLIDVVPLGIDISRFQPAKSDYVYRTLGLPRNRKVVIYVGHMEERKGVRTLVQAAMELLLNRRRRDVCFLIFGNKGEESKPYEALYEGKGVQDLIRFGGYRSDLALIYPSCFCGVIPSTGWDSFPRSSLEMAASGLPVVASRLQGLPEAVLDGKTGLLFDPGNSVQLADALALLLDRPDLAESYGRAGRARCEQELNLQKQRERLLGVFRKRLGIGSDQPNASF